MRCFVGNSIRILFSKLDQVSPRVVFIRDFHTADIMSKNKIPDRWEKYEKIGKVVEGTRFIAFKVPLKEFLCHRLEKEEDWFTPKDLVDAVKEQNVELGLVIDLTNTRRYYDERSITDQGIEYKKIFTEGHSVPSKAVQKNFFEAVDNFMKSDENKDRVIGVHCTHGLNRTGYLVCRYMIDKLKIEADVAIEAFNTARGHAIERDNYLRDLRGQPIAEFETEDRSGIKRSATHDVYEETIPTKMRRTEQRCTDTRNYSDNNFRQAHNSSWNHHDYPGGRTWNHRENGPHSSAHGHHYPRHDPQEYYPQHHDYNYHDRQFSSNNGMTPYNSQYGSHFHRGWGRPDWSEDSRWAESDYGQFGRRNCYNDDARRVQHRRRK